MTTRRRRAGNYEQSDHQADSLGISGEGPMETWKLLVGRLLHRAATLRTPLRIDFLDPLDEHGPSPLGRSCRPGRGAAHLRCRGAWLPLPPASCACPGLVGVPAVVADQVRTPGRNVLGELGPAWPSRSAQPPPSPRLIRPTRATNRCAVPGRDACERYACGLSTARQPDRPPGRLAGLPSSTPCQRSRATS